MGGHVFLIRASDDSYRYNPRLVITTTGHAIIMNAKTAEFSVCKDNPSGSYRVQDGKVWRAGA